VGCNLVPNNTWPTAPLTTPIIGLKELPVSTEPLKHVHVHFAHCYKRQEGWDAVLTRFHEGKGTLYDLEFLQDATGRRVAAFGYHAGFAGAAAGALAFAALRDGVSLGELKPFPDESEMISAVKAKLAGRKGVKALVMGALGRCGRGAVDLFRKVGLEEYVPYTGPRPIVNCSNYSSNIIKWDMAETAKGGPFDEILDVDIFINCIYLSSKIPPFITTSQIEQAGKNRRLSVIIDVSCDTTNPYNPIPIYSVNTTFDRPTVPVDVG
jgi:saccharopine dehydrogenase (NAD+, L-lysine forming)